MKLLKQLSVIAGFSIIGEIISYLLKELLDIFIPGSLIGMIILFILLTTKVIKYDFVDDVGEFFVNNMGFFFVPVAASTPPVIVTPMSKPATKPFNLSFMCCQASITINYPNYNTYVFICQHMCSICL